MFRRENKANNFYHMAKIVWNNNLMNSFRKYFTLTERMHVHWIKESKNVEHMYLQKTEFSN